MGAFRKLDCSLKPGFRHGTVLTEASRSRRRVVRFAPHVPLPILDGGKRPLQDRVSGESRDLHSRTRR
eukprot:801042-Pleurochrysis_carterae.AAC.1